MIKKLIIFCTLTIITPFVLADQLCGSQGEFNPVENKCYPIQNRGNSGGQVPIVDLWGAIAADMSPNQAMAGSSSNFRVKAQANQSAIDKCGLTTCQVIITYKNTCGAIAVGSNKVIGSATNTTKSVAESNAIKNCKNNGGQNCLQWNSSCSGQKY